MTTRIRCARCARRHWSWRAAAACSWPGALWIHGYGPWAVVSECRTSTCDGNLTSGHDAFVMVSLHATEADADEALRSVNSTDCGGCCRGRRHHYIEALDCAGCLDHDDRALTLEDL